MTETQPWAGQSFGRWVSPGDTVTIEHEGFKLMATIYHDPDAGPPDERDEGFWPSQNPTSAGWIGHKTDEEFAMHMAFAKEVMRQWENDDWFYCGVAVTVSKNGITLTDRYTNTIWGVECNYPKAPWAEESDEPNDYLIDIADQVTDDALAEARHVLATLCECKEAA